MSEYAGHRPPENTNISESEIQPDQLPIDVFEGGEQINQVNPKTIAIEGLATAIAGMRARSAERRVNRKEERVEKLAHKLELLAQHKERVEIDYSAKEENEARGKKEPVRPKGWLDRHQDKKFSKAAHKKALADVDAYRAEKVFGTVEAQKKKGALTQSERRQKKREIRKKYKKGELSYSEARQEKLDIDAAPLRLDKVMMKPANRKQAKAARKAESMVRPFKEKRLKYQYGKAVDAVEQHNGHANRLRAEHEARKNRLNTPTEHQLKDPEYYLDSANMLSLKRSISRESNRRLNEQLHAGLVASRAKIEAQTELEGIARYFGYKTWDEAEENVPAWLMDGVMQLYGFSEQELEAEAEREQRPITRSRSHQPLELSHDESIHLRDEEKGIDSFQVEDGPEVPEAEPVEQPASRNQLEEIINPERDPYAGYEQKIRTMAQRIDAAIEEQTAGITNPNEKRNIVDAVYKEAIADFFGMSEEDLANDTGVPKELLNQVVSDIKTARREIDQNETEAAKRIAYNVAQRVSFRLAEETRGKSLTEKEREDLKFNLFLETLASELSVTPEDLDNPKLVSQRLKKKALARIDQNEKERLERVAKMDAEEAAKTPEQRRADADNEQLDKLRNIIND